MTDESVEETFEDLADAEIVWQPRFSLTSRDLSWITLYLRVRFEYERCEHGIIVTLSRDDLASEGLGANLDEAAILAVAAWRERGALPC